MINSSQKLKKKTRLSAAKDVILAAFFLILYLSWQNVLVGVWLIIFILGIMVPYLFGVILTLMYLIRYRRTKREEELLIYQEN
jgi:Flp pilus assembly protein TadB